MPVVSVSLLVYTLPMERKHLIGEAMERAGGQTGTCGKPACCDYLSQPASTQAATRCAGTRMQFEDFERARFVNQALRGMWPFLDAAMCGALKEVVEPSIQSTLPFPVASFSFEKLAFGSAPFEVRGVKHASLFAGATLRYAPRCARVVM